MALNDALDQMGLTDRFRTFHPKAVEYTVFSSAHGTFSRTDHILGHKSAFNKYKNIEIRGAWVAQSVGRPTSAQVMISWFMSLSPASGSLSLSQNK